jgi:cytochrome c oxidase subunit II
MRDFGNILAPYGSQAGLIAGETRYLLVMATIVFVVVASVLLIAVLRHRHGRLAARTPETRLAVAVGAGLAVTTAILTANLVIDMRVAHALGHLSRDGALTIRITGQQWWWQIEYQHATPSKTLTTANEIHVPVGEPVRLELRSTDVIHSFWVPELHGKRDLIPGLPGSLWIEAAEPGLYRGECAEFCGHQHANMGMLVVAEPRADFDRWYEAQLAPAGLPQEPLALEGRQTFLDKACPLCHSVRGTEAGGRVGPDLTHVASRQTIAAGRLPNSADALQRWVLDPHVFKPGVKMPQNPLQPRELQALVAYLESLR